jgi:hypothetical protein
MKLNEQKIAHNSKVIRLELFAGIFKMMLFFRLQK